MQQQLQPSPQPQPTTPPMARGAHTGYMFGETLEYAPCWDQPAYQQGSSSMVRVSASSAQWAMPTYF
jgi:hypothetical protein